ncbi:MAG: hypothetical protein LBP35_05765 [Candidatus Ancillula trichonymphae]|nr:hypothetical protein [Candidatus Ancillula trichonymphae]
MTYAKLYSKIAILAPDYADVAIWNDSQISIATEKRMQAKWFEENGYDVVKYTNMPMSHTTLEYVGHMAITGKGTYTQVLATVLPCATLYREIGEEILRRAQKAFGRDLEGHPYQSWILSYGSDEFQEAVDAMIQVIDDAASRVNYDEFEEMLRVHNISHKCEFDFFNQN